MPLSIQRDVDLAAYTTYRLPGRAARLTVARSPEDLQEACRFARAEEIPAAVLGAGSNVVVDEAGYPGLVIVNRVRRLERRPGSRVEVGAGEELGALVDFTRQEGLGGLARLAGIPGTVGGAVFGNAGAFGAQIGERVEEVRYVDGGCREAAASREDCAFSYRSSAFKRGALPGIISSVTLRLEPAEPGAVAIAIEETLRAREGKHPAGASCGSYFKNVDVGELDPRLRERLADYIVFDRIPAGRLIQETGSRGLRVGGAVVSDRHCNFLMNDGSATAADVKALAEAIKERVREHFGIELEEEVRYL